MKKTLPKPIADMIADGGTAYQALLTPFFDLFDQVALQHEDRPGI